MTDRDDDFPSPVPHRLTLHDGQFVDIKKRLTYGEREDLYGEISPHGGFINRRIVRIATIDAYLLSWSLTKAGVPVPMQPASETFTAQARRDTIRSLNPARADEIFQAIDAHEKQMAEDRAAQKKIPPGSPTAAASSPLPSAVGGPSPPAPSEP